MSKLICVDDKNMPEDFPKDKWVTEGEFYTLEDAFLSLGGVPAVTLQEFDLSGEKYSCYRASRFEQVKEATTEELSKELESILQEEAVL